jgi:hypothetical protein
MLSRFAGLQQMLWRLRSTANFLGEFTCFAILVCHASSDNVRKTSNEISFCRLAFP